MAPACMRPPNKWPAEETDNPLYADDRNFYKVEKWTNDGRVERMLYAGDLGKAKDIVAKAIKHRPRIRLTIRQRTRWHSTSLDARRCCAGLRKPLGGGLGYSTPRRFFYAQVRGRPSEES
jgi:hypothetical protein